MCNLPGFCRKIQVIFVKNETLNDVYNSSMEHPVEFPYRSDHLPLFYTFDFPECTTFLELTPDRQLKIFTSECECLYLYIPKIIGRAYPMRSFVINDCNAIKRPIMRLPTPALILQRPYMPNGANYAILVNMRSGSENSEVALGNISQNVIGESMRADARERTNDNHAMIDEGNSRSPPRKLSKTAESLRVSSPILDRNKNTESSFVTSHKTCTILF